MSQGGRPTERTKHEPHERHLIGPNVFLERIEDAGGVPESVLHGLRDSPQSPAAKDAADAMSAFTETLIQHLTATNPDAVRPAVSDDPNRRVALMMSVMTSLKESVPKKKWCRHIRAADPHVTEIRTIVVAKAGIWKCSVCFGQSSPAELSADLWPTECDLCGAETQQFNAVLGNLPGCQVQLHVCDDCAAFMQTRC